MNSVKRKIREWLIYHRFIDEPDYIANGTWHECESKMRQLTNGERGCQASWEHKNGG